MNKLQEAMLFDQVDKPLEASLAYEDAFKTERIDLDVIVDAAVLYFVCLDGGYAAAHHLSEDFLTTAWARAFELLDQADSLYNNPPEISFWRLYFSFILLGEEPGYEACEKMVNKEGLLIPVFHLLSSSHSRQYVNAAKALLEQVREGKTVKQRYIKSVLESGLKWLSS